MLKILFYSETLERDTWYTNHGGSSQSYRLNDPLVESAQERPWLHGTR